MSSEQHRSATVPHPVQSTSGPATTELQNAKVASNKPSKKDKKGASDSPKAPLELDPLPDYIPHRIKMWNELKAEYEAFVRRQPRQLIEITLPDGSKRSGTSWETSPMAIAKEISPSLAQRIVISKVNGELWDLERPLECSVTLEFLDFNHPEGKRVFWHSSAHVMGEAAERHYGCHLCIGPPTSDGFYYEMAIADRSISPNDFPALETIVRSAVNEKQPFERLVVSKEGLLEMFAYNKYKVHLIKNKIPDGTSTTVYRCGPMIDLCLGPHIPTTGKIKAMMITKNSSSYFLGDAANDSLQRLWGISFPETKQLTEYKEFLAEAAKRDHRKIGKDQELFFFHELSPGSCFFLPHGTRIYNTLLDLIRSEYRKRGYSEVISPNIYNHKLWETSGHWQNYKEDMFTLDVEKEVFALKPMNCPGHALIFDSRDRSYRELPIRMAEFGVLHRNEASGALSGLSRVRRFQQDDTHVFCMQSQIEQEIDDIFDFLKNVYGLFGFEFGLKLSTRPEKFLGEIDTWDEAERQLRNTLERFQPGKWDLNPGDGAFYGPKIDITITDALKRPHQCATIQLDFQLPERFNLKYRGPDDDENAVNRPVMIHRAILGSLERFISIATEHFGGKWPFWLSPRQVLVIPIAAPYNDYASHVQQRLWNAGLFADVDNGTETINKKIRNGEIGQYNFILVVGEAEFSTQSVNVRNRDDVGLKGRAETIKLDDIVGCLVKLKEERRLQNRI
ncbi:uncharacterized protein EI90DRAFT_2992146 [Cantharellus anzutake]|uniref:uncharacterized protein n=1 Tax=Cantharellus anzutake TaxID=1750568 RepID=UPI001902C47B|nr:uncharacterized protein EI90DRAFT_2992146 [Cantharellus anzutake]KAF8336975.1 hypothetical protein EI90DRAFT_2992146 [Cantharellus anzutake]